MGSTYSIQKRADGWIISVGENQILKCSKRATAIYVTQQAAHRLGLPDEAIAPSPDAADDPIEMSGLRLQTVLNGQPERQ